MLVHTLMESCMAVELSYSVIMLYIMMGSGGKLQQEFAPSYDYLLLQTHNNRQGIPVRQADIAQTATDDNRGIDNVKQSPPASSSSQSQTRVDRRDAIHFNVSSQKPSAVVNSTAFPQQDDDEGIDNVEQSPPASSSSQSQTRIADGQSMLAAISHQPPLAVTV